MEAYLFVLDKGEVGPIKIPDHIVPALRPWAVLTFHGGLLKMEDTNLLGVPNSSTVSFKVCDPPHFEKYFGGNMAVDGWNITINCTLL
jgi:hypothetical protein